MDTETGRLSALLAAAYGIKAADIHEQAGGWSARAFCAEDRSGKRYFLKFYEKRRPSVLKWASYLSFYIPFLRRACAHPALRRHFLSGMPQRACGRTGQCFLWICRRCSFILTVAG